MRKQKRQIVSLHVLLFVASVASVATVATAEAHTLVGVVDREGREVLPCRYADIQNVANKLFILQEYDADKTNISSERQIVDHDGKHVEYKLPLGFNLIDVVMPTAESNTKFPQKTILVVCGAGKYGLANKTGDFVVKPQYSGIQYFGDDMFRLETATDDGVEYYLFDNTSGQKFSIGKQNLGGYFANGKLFFTCKTDSELFSKPVKCGFLNRKGEIQEFPFPWIGEFDNGVAPISIKPPGVSCIQIDDRNRIISGSDPAMAYVNKANEILSPRFDSAESFKDDVAIARLGDRFGIINRKFQFITRKKYSTLKRVPPDVFIGNESGTTSWTAFNNTGKLLFTFPTDVFLVDGASDGLIICRVKDANGKFSDNNGQLTYEAFDQNGNLRWKAPLNGGFEAPFKGMFVASKNGFQWIIDDHGNQVVAPQRSCVLRPADENRFIKILIDEHFNQADWNKQGKTWGSRFDEFRRFLNDYNLIGMSKEEVSRLLGKPPRYSLYRSGCALGSSGFELEFDGEHVKQWRMVQGVSHGGPWITRNMVLTGTRSDSLIPKELSSTNSDAPSSKLKTR